MPTTVTSTSGVVYHLWQLPELSAKQVSPGIEFNELRNELGNGHHSQVLYGSNTGLRSWSLKLPTLADTTVLPNTVTGVNGETVSREAYLWDLYCETRVTGRPFVYTCPRNGQYYLVDFKDKSLKYEKEAYVKLYGTGIELEQVRLDGETVFDPSLINPTNYDVDWWKGDTAFTGFTSWPTAIISGADLDVAGDVTEVADVINGHDIKRFSSTTSDGVMTTATAVSVQEMFLVMKMRESTFSNAAGIATGTIGGSNRILWGSSGTSKFANPSLSSFTYRLNGVEHEQSDMQAPMGAFGIVHVRYPTGWTVTHLQIGQDRATAGTFAKMDVAEIMSSANAFPVSLGREITEYLIKKYAITT